MEVRLLGPVEVRVRGGAVDVGQPMRRLALAALAVDAGRPVSWTTLIDRIWSTDAPSGARATLRATITRLRQVLDQAADADDGPPVRLGRGAGGYLLDVAREQVDVLRFHDLTRQARDESSLDRQVALLREALALWRGEPLFGLRGDWPERARATWEQQRLAALAAWGRAEALTGTAAAALGPLTEAVREHPTEEPLVGALMQVLDAAGQPAQALELYETTRAVLADRLGVGPGPVLREQHGAILRGEPAPVRRAVVRASQLPADVPGFVGRIAHLDTLDRLLAGREQTATVVISAICGTAGVGKTALAVHWAHTVADRFPDGQLYVNLRGFDPDGRVVPAEAAVRDFLDALGVPPDRVPATAQAQAALYRSALAGRRVLIVLDNARDAAQVRPLLPGASTVLVVVTSRTLLTPLVAAAAAHPLTVDALSVDESWELLARRLGATAVAADPAATDKIITACAGLPLALTVAAARVRQTTFPLGVVAAELADARLRLDALDGGDPASQVRAVFSWSYGTLSPGAARLFRLLGLHPGPDLARPAVAAMAGCELAATRAGLSELVQASLLGEPVPGRFAFHDLVHVFAAELAATTDPDSDRSAAVTRLLDHYTRTARTATEILHPRNAPPALPFVLDADGGEGYPADEVQARAWLATELPVLLVAVRHAAATGLDRHAWWLAWLLDTYLDCRGRWRDLLTIWQVVVVDVHLLGDGPAAYAHRAVARCEGRLGLYPAAHASLLRALDLFARAGDQIGMAHTHHQVALTYGWQDQPDLALEHAEQALRLHRQADNLLGQATALNAVGWYHALLGNYRQTLSHCRQALGLLLDIGDAVSMAATWDSLGYANHHLGRHAEAVRCYHRAAEIIHGLGDRYYEAEVLTHLGDTHVAAGDRQAARTAWIRALRLLTDLDHADVQPLRAKLDGLG